MTGIQQLLVLRCCCGCCGVRGPLTIVVGCGWCRVRLPLTIVVERSLVLVVLNISRGVLDMGVGHIRPSRVLGWIVVLVVSWGIVSKALAYERSDNSEIKYAI